MNNVAADRDVIVAGEVHLQPPAPVVGGPVFPVRVGVVPVVVAGFTGRSAVLDELAVALAGGARGVVVTQGLVGLGGAGKSQVAAAYVRDHQGEFDVVLWVLAESDPTIAFAELGRRLVLGGDDLHALAVAAKDWLGDTDRPWLLVLDNAPGGDVVNQWVPATGRGQVIVTSRNHGIGVYSTVITVDVFDTATGAAYLMERTNSSDEAGARVLSDALGGLPLALSHAIGTKDIRLLREVYYNENAARSAALLPRQLTVTS